MPQRATDSVPSPYDSLPGVEGLKALEAPLEFPFDSLPPEDGIIRDSVVLTDTTRVLLDTTRTRFSKINRDAPDIKSPVTFSAKDSLVMNRGNAAHLYGDGNVEYEDFKLNSAEIRMDLDSSTVYANGVPDSVGELANTPIFKDKSGEYESKTMKYNFKSQRGYITGVITEQQDGYLTGGRAKRMDDGAFFVEDGKYTTCEDHENPHFYFRSRLYGADGRAAAAGVAVRLLPVQREIFVGRAVPLDRRGLQPRILPARRRLLLRHQRQRGPGHTRRDIYQGFVGNLGLLQLCEAIQIPRHVRHLVPADRHGRQGNGRLPEDAQLPGDMEP